MKPVKLVFRGLNSYTNEARIDFEKLHNAGIFGIFGETGSGKTTILDAITIALYSRTDRLNSISEVTNPSVGRVYVRFKFEMNGRLYEVYREFENGNAKFQALYEYVDHSKKPLADKARDINEYIREKIIGLDFDDFTKVVILPQGKFSKFLDAGPAEKTRILGKILGTEIFGERFFNAVKNRRDFARSKISDLKNQLDDLEEINENKIESLTKEREKIKNSLDVLKRKKSELEERHRVLVRLQELLDERKELEKQLEKFKEQEPEIKRLKEKLETAEKLAPLAILVQSIERAKERKEKLEETVAKLEDQLEQLEPAYIKKKEEWENFIQREYPESQRKLHLTLQNVDNAMRRSLEIKKLEQKVRRLSFDFEKMERQLQDFETLSEKLQKLKSKLEETNLAPEDEELLKIETEIISLKNELDYLQKQLESTKEKYLRDKDGVGAKIQKLLRKVRVPESVEDPVAYLREVIEKINTLKSEKEKLLEEKENLNLAAKLAENLKEGEPCPVCGSVHHPDPVQGKIHDDEIDELRDEIKQLEEREKKLIGTFERLSELVDSLDALKNRFEKEKLEIEVNLGKTEEKILSIVEKFGCKSIDRLIKKLSETKARKETFDRLSNDERKLSDNIRSLQEVKEKSKVIELEFSQTKNRIEELQNEIKELVGDNSPEEVKKITKRKLDELEKRKERLMGEFEAIKRSFEDLKSGLKTNKGLWGDTVKNLSEYQHQLENEAKRLNMSVEKLKKSILPEEDLKKLKAKVNGFEKIVNELETRLKRVGEELKKLPFYKLPDGEPENTRKLLDSVSEQLDSLNVKLGEIGKAIDETRKKMDMKKRLEKDLSEYKKTESYLSELYSLFHGKKFSKFVARFYLTEIIQEANQFLFELTGGRLKIVGTKGDEIEFQIFDSFTGHARSTKSLSGGERFLVSFSLAISFSLYIQRRSTKSIDFFFIDEGFGTLDEELQEAMGRVFEQIQGTGKLVGLITHVHKFREIVPAHILVTRDPITKSSKIQMNV